MTEAGEDLRPVVMALGFWGQRWVESSLPHRKLDPSLLMWEMRRSIDPTPLPKRRCTIRFSYPNGGPDCGTIGWWSSPRAGRSCARSTPAMTAIWMGLTTIAAETARGHIQIDGDRAIIHNMQQWLGLSPFAKEKSRRSIPADLVA